MRALGRGGGVADAAVDLYDNAFVLLALAWFARATGSAAPIAAAHRTLDAIEARMRAGDTPGFANAWPPEPGPRLQNPHMHLLEAALALHDATGGGEARFTDLARAMVSLFRERLFDPATGTLAELYGPAWQRLHEPYPGRQIWPGHHYEWVWLLHQAEARTGLGARGRRGRSSPSPSGTASTPAPASSATPSRKGACRSTARSACGRKRRG